MKNFKIGDIVQLDSGLVAAINVDGYFKSKVLTNSHFQLEEKNDSMTEASLEDKILYAVSSIANNNTVMFKINNKEEFKATSLFLSKFLFCKNVVWDKGNSRSILSMEIPEYITVKNGSMCCNIWTREYMGYITNKIIINSSFLLEFNKYLNEKGVKKFISHEDVNSKIDKYGNEVRFIGEVLSYNDFEYRVRIIISSDQDVYKRNSEIVLPRKGVNTIRKEFSKSDLKDGMVVIYRVNKYEEYDKVRKKGYDNYFNKGGIVVGESILSKDDYMNLDSYKDDLTTYSGTEKFDIVEVYKVKLPYGGLRMLDNIGESVDNGLLELIWSRDDLLNFKKYDKVQVRNFSNDEWENAYFVGYDNLNIQKYKVCKTLPDEFTGEQPPCFNYRYIRKFEKNTFNLF
ncbi:hypothetical protein [Clostridium perfringens]|uniref:hypothetical protein n=1 Tax=Clostridium perfringens TaxID=1502 RepID=UPI001E5A9CFC|nr:hypothetical protein [Clostridium perfringens]WVL78276.1 hypothetical protein LMS42_015040 [Clostridium perfringens]